MLITPAMKNIAAAITAIASELPKGVNATIRASILDILSYGSKPVSLSALHM